MGLLENTSNEWSGLLKKIDEFSTLQKEVQFKNQLIESRLDKGITPNNLKERAENALEISQKAKKLGTKKFYRGYLFEGKTLLNIANYVADIALSLTLRNFDWKRYLRAF